MGRVAQGERVIPRQGTRQKSDRKFAIRSAMKFNLLDGLAAAKVCLATV